MPPSKLNGSSSAPTSFLTSLTNGFRSGLISPAPSTSSITPITPMTPLTTPRTPAQALIGRYPYVNKKDNNNNNSQPRQILPPQLPTSDDDREQQLVALHLFANFLNAAENAIEDISERENDGKRVVGPGIMRLCNDLADGIQHVAEELDREHQHIEKVMSDHDLRLVEEGSGAAESKDASETVLVASDETILVLPSSHEELLTTISAAHTVLLDMATALRAITQEEAQELGEVALEVANMMIWSLRMVYSNMMHIAVSSEQDGHSQRASGTKQVTWGNGNSNSNLVPLVEILGEEEKKDEHYNPGGTPPQNGRYAPQLPTIPSSPTRVSHSIPERVRVLWPPLLPAVTEASKHCVCTAKEHPLAATAIGLTCGPAAITTAVIAGPPLLIADWAIQSSYEALSHHTPVVETLEKGAASALQVARLSVLCTKLVVKQGLSVGERQIKRRGGVGKVCEDVVDGAVNMATHPLDTAGKAWEGLFWMGGALRDTVGCVVDSVNVHVDMHG
mmetsp:Transcript_2871/g.4372  ORF Transcript_2871/g.4372 Transcript_2871/m.4372 type:complete len:506 (+) Transcript_2871:311-1828(+)